MPWGGEVLGHTLILTSPLAACYGARLLARLVAELEQTSRGVTFRNSLSRFGAQNLVGPQVRRRTADCIQGLNEAGCFQYDNAAYSSQSGDGSGIDGTDGEDEELDFCILTPQQALGALGEHATKYAKIFLNGYTFVADRSEPGTVLSVDEYVDRMHVYAVSRYQSEGGSAAGMSPTGCPATDSKSVGAAYLRSTDGGLSTDHLSACGGSVSLTLNSSCGQEDSMSALTVSERSSFEFSMQSYQSSPCLMCTSRPALGKEGEEDLCSSTSWTYPDSLGITIMDGTPVHMERESGWEVETSSGQDSGHSNCTAPATPRELSAPPRPTVSPQPEGAVCMDQQLSSSSMGQLPMQTCAKAAAALQGDRKGNAIPSKGQLDNACASRQARRSEAMQQRSSVSHGGHGSVAEAKCPQRRWVPSGVRSVPPFSSPISRGNGLLSSSLSSRMSHRENVTSSSMPLAMGSCTSERNLSCSCEVTWGQHSPPQPPRSRPCGNRSSGGAPSSPVTSPIGLCRAPALPLPDGSTLESAVPPALRYYLAQARAAGTQDSRTGGVDRTELDVITCRRSSGDGETEQGMGVDCLAGRPGFVRATVEQLNTRRLVCCHVSAYAGAKTSRKPRPLGHGAASVK